MAGIVIERSGFINAPGIIGAIVADMAANGFTIISPSNFNANSVTAPAKILLEATGAVDPLNAPSVTSKQPWRIMFDVQEIQTCFVYVGTPTTLPDNATVQLQYDVVTADSGEVYAPVDVVGNINARMSTDNRAGSSEHDAYISDNGVWTPAASSSLTGDEPQYGFINRRYGITANGTGAARPMRYHLAISDHGIWVGIWEDADSASKAWNFNWFLVQRPVDRDTGQVITTGKAPVWCLAYNGANLFKPEEFYFFQTVVRESDVIKPSGGLEERRRADSDSDDSNAVINSVNQVSLMENGAYTITFPSRLNTTRFYYTYELDMIGYSSADVAPEGALIPIQVYGESTPREYYSTPATWINGTGVRIFVVNKGAGIV